MCPTPVTISFLITKIKKNSLKMRIAWLLGLILLSVNASTPSRRRANTIRVNFALFPTHSHIIGNLDATADFLENYDGYLISSLVKVLLKPLLYVKRDKSYLASSKLCKYIHTFSLDALALKEDRIEIIAGLMVGAFNVDEYSALSGLVVLWQFDWLVHLSFQLSHKSDIIETLLASKIKVIDKMKKSKDKYWKDIVYLGSIPFSPIIVENKDLFSNSSVAYDLSTDYEWPDVLHRIEFLLSNSPDIGRHSLRALAETLPQSMLVLGRLNQLDESFSKSLLIKLSNKWFLVSELVQLTFLLQLMSYNSTEFGGELLRFLIVTSKSLIKQLFVSFLKASNTKEVARGLSLLESSPYFFLRLLKLYARINVPKINPEYEKIYSEMGQLRNGKLPSTDADLPKIGKFLGYWFVKFFDDSISKFPQQDQQFLSELIAFLLKSDQEAGQRILSQFYEDSFPDAQVDKIRRCARILVCIYFKSLLEEQSVVDILETIVNSHSTADLIKFEISLQQVAGSFIFEAMRNGLPSRNFTSLFGNIPKSKDFVEMSNCKNRIVSINLKPELISRLALAIAFISTENSAEEREKAFPSDLILFIKEDWHIFDQPMMYDLAFKIFPQVRNAIIDYETHSDPTTLLYQTRSIFMGNQFLWALRCLVKEMTEYIRYISVKERTAFERELFERVYSSFVKTLGSESDMDTRLWNLIQMLSASTRSKLIGRSHIDRIIEAIYPRNDKLSKYYRMIARDYFVCVMSNSSAFMDNPRMLKGGESLFKIQLSKFEQVGRYSKQIMACVILSKPKGPSPEDIIFISSVFSETQKGQALEYFLVCKSRYYIMFAPVIELAEFLGPFSSFNIFLIFLNVPVDRTMSLFRFLIGELNGASALVQKRFKKIAFSLILNANFHNFVPTKINIQTWSKFDSDLFREIELCKRFVHLVELIVLSLFENQEIKFHEHESQLFETAKGAFMESPYVLNYFLETMIKKPFRNEPFILVYIDEMLTDPLSVIDRKDDRKPSSQPPTNAITKTIPPPIRNDSKMNDKETGERKKDILPLQEKKASPPRKITKSKSPPPIHADKKPKESSDTENTNVDIQQELQSTKNPEPKPITKEVEKERKIEDLFRFDLFGFGIPKGNLENEDLEWILSYIETDGFPFCLNREFYELLLVKKVRESKLLTFSSQAKWLGMLKLRPIEQLKARSDLWKCKKEALQVNNTHRRYNHRALDKGDVASMLEKLDDTVISRIQSLLFYSGNQTKTGIINFTWLRGRCVKVKRGVLYLGLSLTMDGLRNELLDSFSDRGINSRIIINSNNKLRGSEESDEADIPGGTESGDLLRQSDVLKSSKEVVNDSICLKHILSESADSTQDLIGKGSEKADSSQIEDAQGVVSKLHSSHGDLTKKFSSPSLPVKSLSADSLPAELMPFPLKALPLNANADPFVPAPKLNIWHAIGGIRSWNFTTIVNRITRDNFTSMFPILKRAIIDSTMISFDCEMSGLFPPSKMAPIGGFFNNFDEINLGAHEIYQLVQMGLTLWWQRGATAMVSIWSVMLCKDEKPEDIMYDPAAFEKIKAHGFRIESHREECIDTRSFMRELYPLMVKKTLIVHNGLADFIHLFQASLDGKRFDSETEFLKFLDEQVKFYDTKAIAVYFRKIPVRQTDLASLARREIGFDFDPLQVHEASFDSFLTLKLFLYFLRDFHRYQSRPNNVLFANEK